MQYQHIPDSAMEVTTEVGLHGESSQTGRVRFFMCILLSRALLTLACSGICISLFFGLLFIWRLRRPLIGRARSLILTWTQLKFRILNSAQYRECLATILNGINIHIQLPMRIEPYLTDGYWTTDMLTTWRMSRTGTKRGHVLDPRPTKSRFPV